MLPCTDFSSCFWVRRFYFCWRARACVLFPVECITLYSVSCAHKTRQEDREVTQELNYLVKTPPRFFFIFFHLFLLVGGLLLYKAPPLLKATNQYLIERETGCGTLLFWLRSTVTAVLRSSLFQCILHTVPDEADLSLGFWTLSTSLGSSK